LFYIAKAGQGGHFDYDWYYRRGARMKVFLSYGQRFAAEDWHCPSCNKSPEIVDGFLFFAPDLVSGNGGFGAEANVSGNKARGGG